MIAAILLAAGASRRMGSPKALLPWGGTSLISWELNQLMESSVEELVVVLGSRSEDIRRTLGNSAKYSVFNQLWTSGRATSLVRGAKALIQRGTAMPQATVIQNVDQPTRSDIIDFLVKELMHSGADAIQPEYHGHGGHPVVIASHMVPLLLGAEERTFGLRGVLNHHPPLRIPMNDEPVVAVDIDTPDKITSARKLFSIADP